MNEDFNTIRCWIEDWQQNKNQESAANLFKLVQPIIKVWCYQKNRFHTSDEHESVANESFLKAINTFDVSKNAKFSNYFIKILRRDIVDYFRRNRKFNNEQFDEKIEIVQKEELKSNADLPAGIFSCLDEFEKQLVYSYYVKNMTHRAIGKELNMAYSVICVKLNQALNKMKTFYKESNL